MSNKSSELLYKYQVDLFSLTIKQEQLSWPMTSLFSLLQPSMSHQQIASGTRWYPTPEQLAILRALYRGGVRTLCGSQIRQIAAYLSFYGRIEPKNVFYWFQNRKARDRQKLRRSFSQQQKTSSTSSPQLQQGGMEETTQAANLVCEQKQMSGSNEHSWIRILNMELNARPLETLELFPTRSDGDLK